ncbi:carboxypeptidase-like regulatory domain-containing protein [Flavivirga sp. 57AJ16]|uniref:carboxypeptidase-like regulatory domain-containing protein n=1 Tax=Flavivirga sp. 57AJ16 TaxID=3025307 RepID=UPI002366B964|nr:carboxypeptidase-like regulatory domain-containing protein [Flavivirga sp. 57AJ16]MDD7884678.1 carboxypeptidase-like regulatory domain-containing protein [Flavivirga sp. 57AJ16]
MSEYIFNRKETSPIKKVAIILFILFSTRPVLAQQTLIKGSVKDALAFQPIENVIINIEETTQQTQTDALGEFVFSVNVPLGEHILKISKLGYITKRYPIVVNEHEVVNITDMTLELDNSLSQDLFTISLTDDELDDNANGLGSISGLLQASPDIFQRTAAFEFSASFFKLRGLDSDQGSVMINGIEMNKIYNGRPQWSHWGGLNDVIRHQELSTGLAPSNYHFGGLLGSININTRASQKRSGRRLTYSSSDRSYTNRLMATYASGLLKSGWAYTLSLGRRWGNEGYQDATIYSSNSVFMSTEKVINDKHSLSFTGIYAPNRRGKSSANTQEVYNLKGIKYNEYWGWQGGKKRNSRIKEVEEPIVMLNHYWHINSKTKLNTNIGYQFGKLGNSRLAYGGPNRIVNNDGTVVFESGGQNPSPTYYQKLPSYFERNFPNDLEFAYGAQQAFLNNGQVNWEEMYRANLISTSQERLATYMLYEDRVDDDQLTLNTIFSSELSEHLLFNASINYKKLESKNYAQVLDLLGGSGFLNVDSFDGVQFDLKNPNTMVGVGGTYGYHYNMFANIISGYAQAQFTYNPVDFFVSGSVTNTQYQREGLFQYETFKDNSFGKGEVLSFTGLGLKVGGTYKITGKHIVDIHAGYIIKAPSIRNSYSNSRANHNIVPNISEEKIMSLDASYIFRSPIVKAKLTGFYTQLKDANDISFFFADGIGHVIAESGTQRSGYDDNEFIQEILQGIHKNHLGIELGIEAQVTPTVKLKGVAALGGYTYANNPDLYLSSDRFENVYLGTSKLKDYKLAVGPHRAYSIGFEYRDPEYWWFGATVNFFDKIYVDISPLTRTDNFFKDVDGLPFVDYDETIAKALLKQASFDDYMVVNLVGGKSWRVNQYYMGFFASINNVLDEVFKTGGFEQGRQANYRQLREDQALNKPVFGPKYWYGRGATYFLNLYVNF